MPKRVTGEQPKFGRLGQNAEKGPCGEIPSSASSPFPYKCRIASTRFRQRLIQQAIAQVLTPLLDEELSKNNFGFYQGNDP